MVYLEEVFKRLAIANLKIKPSKCQFFKEQLNYLGFVVDKNILKPQMSKVEALYKLAIPKSQLDIQLFLGTVNYYKRFIPKFSAIAEPLFHLLRGENKFVWTADCQTSFKTLRLW